jgi:hypothetical protein
VTERAYGTSAFFLAALVAGAGVIHFAMVPTHAADSLVDGIGFAVFGWLQIALAVAIAVRPNKRVLVATIAVNAAALGLWVLSRTVGLPVGRHEGIVEDVGSIDRSARCSRASPSSARCTCWPAAPSPTRSASAPRCSASSPCPPCS